MELRKGEAAWRVRYTWCCDIGRRLRGCRRVQSVYFRVIQIRWDQFKCVCVFAHTCVWRFCSVFLHVFFPCLYVCVITNHWKHVWAHSAFTRPSLSHEWKLLFSGWQQANRLLCLLKVILCCQSFTTWMARNVAFITFIYIVSSLFFGILFQEMILLYASFRSSGSLEVGFGSVQSWRVPTHVIVH